MNRVKMGVYALSTHPLFFMKRNASPSPQSLLPLMIYVCMRVCLRVWVHRQYCMCLDYNINLLLNIEVSFLFKIICSSFSNRTDMVRSVHVLPASPQKLVCHLYGLETVIYYRGQRSKACNTLIRVSSSVFACPPVLTLSISGVSPSISLHRVLLYGVLRQNQLRIDNERVIITL